MNWKEYEKEIFEYYKSEYPNATVSHDVTLPGRYSRINRQIDILIEDYAAGNRFIIIIDGKFFSKNIDVKDVESFIGMVNDIGADKGLMITNKDYSEAALQRAFNDPINTELDILNFDDLKQYQGFVAIPYAGDYSVILPAPFGCVIDINCRDENKLCYIYQRGMNLDKAKKRFEFMYVNFWDKKKDNISLDRIIELQNIRIKNSDSESVIRIKNTIKRDDANTKIRIADIPSYKGLEITGFVEFEEFIFFCVQFTPNYLINKSLRKVEYIIAKIIPVKIKFNNTIVIQQNLKKLSKLQDKEEKGIIRLKISNWYYEMKDIDNAIKILEDTISEFPSHYMTSKRLLILKVKINDYNLISEEINRFYELDSKNPTIYNDLLEIFIEDSQFLYDFFSKKINEVEDDHVLGNLYFYLAQISQSQSEQIEFFMKARSYLEKIFNKDHYIFNKIDESLKHIGENHS